MTLDMISNMGRNEGKHLVIQNNLDDIKFNIPFFQIDGKNIRVGGYKDHDNAPRMIFWASYLQKRVLPFLEKGTNINGYYNIELHDSYSYLNCSKEDYKNVLVWSKEKENKDVVLIPDLYQLANYNNQFLNPLQKDDVLWSDKNNKIGFWGTTTGDIDPLKNKRIQSCLWFFKKDPLHCISDCFITNIAQMKKETILTHVPEFCHIYHLPVDFKYQYRYKFLLDIPGNTCSWDRVPLIMNSNSLFFKSDCKDMCFYYPLLKNKENYVDVEFENDDILKKREYYKNNTNESLEIIKNANQFAKSFLHENAAQQYLISLFTEASFNKP